MVVREERDVVEEENGAFLSLFLSTIVIANRPMLTTSFSTKRRAFVSRAARRRNSMSRTSTVFRSAISSSDRVECRGCRTAISDRVLSLKRAKMGNDN